MRWSEEVAEQLARAYAGGAHLGPAQMRLVEKWQALEARRAAFDNKKWVQKLRGAPLGAGGASPRAGGAPPLAAHPAGRRQASLAGGGAPYFDARFASDESFRSRVAGMGLDVGALPESRMQPPPKAQTPRERIAARFAQARAERQRQKREQDITGGAIDGRNERREVVAMRMYELGIRDAQLAEGFRDPPPPLPPVEQRPDAQAKAQAKMRAEALAAEQWARHALATGEKIDAKNLTEAAFKALLKMKGLAVVSSGPAMSAPLPRR
jgi:hypothetical protein